MGMGLLFTIDSAITLTKTIRDNTEARIVNRVAEAKTEKILNEYELGSLKD